MNGQLLSELIPVHIKTNILQGGRYKIAAGDLPCSWHRGVAFEGPGGAEPIWNKLVNEISSQNSGNRVRIELAMTKFRALGIYFTFCDGIRNGGWLTCLIGNLNYCRREVLIFQCKMNFSCNGVRKYPEVCVFRIVLNT